MTEISQWQRIVESDIETDTAIRRIARRFITELEVEGDSYGVPPLEDVVESLVAIIDRTQKELDAIKPQTKELILQNQTQHHEIIRLKDEIVSNLKICLQSERAAVQRCAEICINNMWSSASDGYNCGCDDCARDIRLAYPQHFEEGK